MSLSRIEEYAGDRLPTVGDHAVVIGAGVAGLVTARVLADAFTRVTVLDRDTLPDEPEPRQGVPQGRHAHVLLIGGQDVIESLCPGFVTDLHAAGAPVLDLSGEFDVHAAGGVMAAGAGGMPMAFASRPLVERVLRDHVTRDAAVTVVPDHQVLDCLASRDGTAVEGVTVLSDDVRWDIRADLVVDAGGRRSRTSAWLTQLGCPPPPVSDVEVDLGYRTCEVTRPAGDQRGALVLPSPPRRTGASVLPVEGDRWLVTLFGLHGDHPPDDLPGLVAFAQSVPHPLVHEVLAEHVAITPTPFRYRFPSSTRRHFERLPHHPPGLVTIGDAIASFNPIYGQGMSVAAQEALALHHALAVTGTDGLAREFHRQAAAIVNEAWQVSAGADFQFNDTVGIKPLGTDLMNRYVARLHRKGHRDGELADAFGRVAVLQDPPKALFTPRILRRVLTPSWSRQPSPRK